MAKYPLTPRQKQFLTELAQKFRDGMGGRLVFLHGDDGITGAIPFGGNEGIFPPEINEDDLLDYAQIGLMQVVRTGQYGLEEVQFYKQLVIDAVLSGFEVHSSLRRGTDNRSVRITTNYGNAGIDSHFEHIVQTVNLGLMQPAGTKEELVSLLTRLGSELQNVTDEYAGEKEAIQLYAEDIATSASVERPNQTRLKISSEGLVKASETIKAVVPNVLVTALAIAKLVTAIHSGMS